MCVTSELESLRASYVMIFLARSNSLGPKAQLCVGRESGSEIGRKREVGMKVIQAIIRYTITLGIPVPLLFRLISLAFT